MASDDATGAVGTDSTDYYTTATSGTPKKQGDNSGILVDAGAATVAATVAGARAAARSESRAIQAAPRGALHAA